MSRRIPVGSGIRGRHRHRPNCEDLEPRALLSPLSGSGDATNPPPITSQVSSSPPHGNLSIKGPVAVNEWADSAIINIERTGGSSGTIQATFQTSGGSATPGQDYRPVSQTFTLPDGVTSAIVAIPILEDAQVEGNETVGLVLTNISGADNPNSQSSSTLVIIDDDTNPSGPIPPPPVTVQQIARYGYHRQPTTLVVRLSGLIAPTAAASSPSNFKLYWLGHDGIFGTGDDQHLSIASASYDPATHAITLIPFRTLPLNTRYGLVVNTSALTDTSGRPVQGNSGDWYISTFGPEALAGPDHNANHPLATRDLTSAFRLRAQQRHAWRLAHHRNP